MIESKHFERVTPVMPELKSITLDDFIPKDYRDRVEKEIASCEPEIHHKWILRRQGAMKLWQEHIQNFADEMQNDISMDVTIDSLHKYIEYHKKHIDYYSRAGSWNKRIRKTCKPSKMRIDNGSECNAKLQRADNG